MCIYDTITYQYQFKLINVSLIIYLLICNSVHTTLVRHPVQSEWGKTAVEKVLEKILK